MQPPLSNKDSSYVAAFCSCTLDPLVLPMPNFQFNKQHFITNILLTKANLRQLKPFSQQLKLNQQFSLIIQRNPYHLPIVDVANFEQHYQGWQPIIIHQEIVSRFKLFPYFKRGCLKNKKCISFLQIFDEFQQEKIEEVTQPSLTQKTQLMHSYFKIQTDNFFKYINFVKKDQIDFTEITFTPFVQGLFERQIGQIDIKNLGILCFPQGVKIFTKQTGFKFFSFIMTNDSAERFYCKSIIFSQKCSLQARRKLFQKYGIQAQIKLYTQKVFTIISKHNCTEYTNQFLQYLYRIYLSQPYNVFLQKINDLPNNFTINTETNKIQLYMQKSVYNFKMNTSYPHTSTQAIYAVFKFLDVENIVTVLQNLLLERKVFFVSDCQNIIGMAIQAFLSFIYPLNWVHPIINPLSSSIIEYTDAPLTIIYGLSNVLVPKIKSNVQGLFVYLDKNKIQLRNSQPISLIINIRKHLMQRLKQFNVYDDIDVNDYLKNPENLALFKTQKTEDPNFDVYKIRNIFFQLTVFMLKNYNHYYIPKNIAQKGKGIRKCYNLDALLHLNRKDPFMHNFFKTSLFTILIERKLQQPDNKWIKYLDRAIRKIQSYNRHFIQQQSDNFSDTNQPQRQQFIFPKGCLSLINNISRQSDEERYPKSSPSPKNLSIFRQYEDQKYISPNKNQGRMSLPNHFQSPNSPNIQSKKFFSKRTSLQPDIQKDNEKQIQDQKSEKETDKGSQSYDKGQLQTPQLKQKQPIIQEFDKQDQNNLLRNKGFSTLLCNIVSYPYRKAETVVSRWTKSKKRQLNTWKNKNHKDQIYGVNMVQTITHSVPQNPQCKMNNNNIIQEQ